jgi:hypothetical protein
MTSSGRRLAFFIAVAIAFALPKRVECGYPDTECARIVDGERCTSYEVEPWGFYLIEKIANRDVGFGYSSGEDCR